MPSMNRYLRKHEKFVKEKIEVTDSLEELKNLREYHLTRIAFIQHERLIHLLVTLAFAVFMFILLIASYFTEIYELFVLAILILVLLLYYIFHYFILENGVQRWYLLNDEIDRHIAEYEKRQG